VSKTRHVDWYSPACETMVYLTERVVGWQDKEGYRQIMGVIQQ